MSYFRDNVERMAGYVPGKQLPGQNIIKLNTNENPFPPTPKINEFLTTLPNNLDILKKYPDPISTPVRETIASIYNFEPDNIITGNGSDDILTIAIRSFVGEGEAISVLSPSYSLYNVLADIQGAKVVEVPLTETFELPSNILQVVDGSKILFLTSPNAPTANQFPKNEIINICKNFSGIVFIDEAYADFAEDNCLDLVEKFDNVIVSRTLSKSYSLAGIRFGYAFSNKTIISGMMKVKDSYNVNYFSQMLAKVAIADQEYFIEKLEEVKKLRTFLCEELKKMDFKVLPSQTNFLFVKPKKCSAKELFNHLSDNNILTRYFPAERTKDYLRISIGTKEELEVLLSNISNFIN
jgi:histidinol-phosphate aminotransferase